MEGEEIIRAIIMEKETSLSSEKCKKCGLPKSEHDEGDVIKLQCPDIDEPSEFEKEELKETSLSGKIELFHACHVIHETDVREAVLRLKKELEPDRDYKTIAYRRVLEKIEEIFGEKITAKTGSGGKGK